ncbi:MAG: diguanylate cyclase [Labilithrix sp.]|nr:diguanylate cyclase [Labilithrix sp.]
MRGQFVRRGLRSPLRLPLVGLVGAVVVLVSLGWVTYRETVEQEVATSLVEHTYVVIQQLQKVPAGIAVAESSIRGYALRRDEGMLDEFDPAMREVDEALRASRDLLADNPTQRRRLELLEPKVARRLTLLHERLEAVKTAGDTAVAPEARHLTLEIRAMTSEMVQEELLLLDRRSFAREDRIRRLRVISPLGIFASISLVAVAFLLVYGEVRNRRRAERASEKQGARLRDLVRETALMLQMGELLSACRSVDEAIEVVGRLAPQFFVDESGAICILNESQNLLEAEVQWGSGSVLEGKTFAPDDCWALRRGKPHRSQQGEASVRCAHSTEGRVATLCLPLLAHGHVIGTLHVAEDGDADRIERRAMVVGEQVGMALSNLRLRETLRNQSIRDALTGLYNRRYTDETLEREIRRAERESSTIGVLVMDVDFFKKFNDSFGHQAGDHVLASIGSLLRKKTRGADVASRMGGEELALVMPSASLDAAAKRAEEIREAVSQMDVTHGGRSIGPVTLSIGVAAFPQHGATADDVIRVADAALYRAKREGRNRVTVAD